MSEVTVAVLRIGFVVLLWLFVFSVVAVLRSDLFGTGVVSRRKTGRVAKENRSRRQAAKGAGQTPPGGIQVPQEVQHVIVVTEGVLRGTTLILQHVPIMIGRSGECALVLDDEFASNRHARIFKQGAAWYVEDLGSTNGSRLNDRPLMDAVPFTPGSVLRIGQSAIEMRKGPR